MGVGVFFTCQCHLVILYGILLLVKTIIGISVGLITFASQGSRYRSLQ